MIPELTALGFTRNEANVYLAALRLRQASIQQLANLSGLNRITVHSIVEKFEHLQIFTHSFEGRRRRISAADPTRLQSLLQREKQTWQHKENVLSRIFPDLMNLHRQGQRGMRVSTFAGVEGYQAMCDDVLTARSEVLEYANLDALMRIIQPYVAKEYLPRKHARQIRSKFLYIDTPSARTYIEQSYCKPKNAAPMQAKFVSRAEFPMDSFYVIYDDKLMIFTPPTLEGVIIQDQTVADSLRPFFHFVWERAGTILTNIAI